MSDKKDNVIQFPTKANVPDTVTISFGDSDPVTYTLSSDNIDLSGIDSDTVTVSLADYNNFNTMAGDWYDFGDSDSITLTTDLTLEQAAVLHSQLSLDLDEDNDK